MNRFEGIARSGAMSYVPAREEKKSHPGRRMLGVVMCAALLGAPLLIPAASRVASLDRAELVSQERVLPKPAAKASSTVPPTVVPPTVVPPTVVAPTTVAPTTAPKARTKVSAKPAPTTAAPKPKARPTTTAAPKPAAAPAPEPSGNTQSGKASWYDTYEGTCAHKSIPKGTMVNVTNTANGKSVVCRVADRGPYIEGRIIDLDRRLFAQLASPSSGVISVNISW